MRTPRFLSLAFLLFTQTLLVAGCAAPVEGTSQAPAAAIAAAVLPAPTPAPGNVTVAAVGDIMMGSTFPTAAGLPPDDGASMLAEVTPILSAADVAFGNLEGPMIDGGVSSKCGSGSRNCHAFRVPTRYGKYLKEAGFDVMSLANNHAGDFGPAGLDSSMRVLDQLGIAHSGRAGTFAFLNVKGKRIALVAFATNNVAYNLNDVETARRVVADLDKKADLVFVSFHGGAEGSDKIYVPRGPETFLGEARGDLRKFSRAVIDAGADLVIGHGPHVIRGLEVYRDRLIAYSLGNFATYGKFNLTGALGQTFILEAELAPDGKFLGGRAHAVKQVKPGGPQLDKAKTVIPVLRAVSMSDFGTSAARVEPDGTIAPPVSVEAGNR